VIYLIPFGQRAEILEADT